MTFKSSGFLSPSMAKYSESIRGIKEYAQWFSYAESLVRLGIEMTDGHTIQTGDKHAVTVAALFFRAHKSFQSAYILCEKGLIGDARAVMRSASEGSIALFALAADPAFIQSVEEAKHHDDRKKARVLTNAIDNATFLTPEEIQNCRDTIQKVDTLEKSAGRQFKDIKWAEVARKKDAHGNDASDLYDLIYRGLSSDGTHTTIDAISRHIEVELGEFKFMKVGPDISDLVVTLVTACNIFLYALVAFDRSFGEKFKDKLQTAMREFDDLPKDEPTSARLNETY